MVQAARQAGTADRRRSSRSSPGGCRMAAATAWSAASAAARRARGVPLRRRRARLLEGVVDADMLDWLASYRSPATSGATPRARPTSRIAPAGRRGDLRRGRPARDPAAVDLQPRLRRRLGRVADDAGRGRATVIEMGSRRTHEQAAVAAARGRTSPASPRPATSRPAALRRPDPGHRRALLHPAPRHRARRLPGSGPGPGRGTTLLVDTYDVTRRCGLRSRSPGRPRRRPPRLRRPRARRAGGARHSSTGSARADPDRGHQRPRRARHRRARRRARRRVRGGHPARDRLGHPTCGFVYKLVGARAPTARWSRSKRYRQGRSAAASTPCAAAPAGPPRPRSSASARRRRTMATTGRSRCPLSRRRGRRPRDPRGGPRAPPSSLAELPRASTLMSAGSR